MMKQSSEVSCARLVQCVAVFCGGRVKRIMGNAWNEVDYSLVAQPLHWATARLCT